MNRYLYLEDLVANALIQKIESGQGRKVNTGELDGYGKRVQRWWKNNRNLNIILACTRYEMNSMFESNPDLFDRIDEDDGSITIQLKQGKTSDDLRKKFRSYLTVDMLIAFKESF